MATSKDKTDNAIDDILSRVADGLVSSSDIEKLGKELGLSIPDITRFIATNVKGTSITSDGTRLMLRTWADGVKPSEIVSRLKSALRNVGMIRLAENMETGAIRTDLPTMSQEDLNIYTEQLKHHYEFEYDTIKASPLDPDSRMKQELIFVNLVLLNEKGKHGNESLEYVKIYDILRSQETERKRKMVFIGEAGVGKSTLLERIAFDWATNKCLREIELLFLLKFRAIENTTSSFGDIVNEFLYRRDTGEISGDVVNTYIEMNQSRTMILLDGLDEYAGDIHKDRDDALVRIIRGERFKNIPLIVTTRPWRADQITCVDSVNKQYQRVRVEGFKPRDVKVYVEKFFHDDAKSAKSLVDLIETNEIVGSHMAPYPIFCAMLCEMWKVESRRDKVQKLETFSKLLEEMVQTLIEQFFEKERMEVATSLEKCQINCRKRFVQIGKIAFDGLVTNRLVYREDMFKACMDDVEIAYEVGVLTAAKKVAPREMRKRGIEYITDVQYPHKLVQEYLAGYYIASLHQTEFKTILNDIMQDYNEFRYLLYFLASRRGAAGLALMEALCKKVDDQDFIMDVAFECQDKETVTPVVNVLQETTTFCSHDHKKILGQHTWRGYLYIWDQCVSDKRTDNSCRIEPSGGCQDAMSRDGAIGLIRLPKLQTLTIEDTFYLEDMFYAGIADGSSKSKIKCMILRNQTFFAAASKHIARAVLSMPNLRSLTIDRADLKDAFYTTLSATPLSSMLEEMNLQNLSLWLEPSVQLAIAVTSMPNLRSFSLNRIRLDYAFYAKMDGLSSNSRIEKLSLQNIPLDAAAYEHMTRAVSSMPNLLSLTLLYLDLNVSPPKKHTNRSSVVKLHLLDCNIIQLSQLGFQDLCPRVKTFQITHFAENINTEMITTISKMWSSFTCLMEVQLQGSGFIRSLQNEVFLCEALLSSCPRLTKLSMTNIDVGNQMAAVIIRAMEAHGSLENILFTRCNTVQDEDFDEMTRRSEIHVTIVHGRVTPAFDG